MQQYNGRVRKAIKKAFKDLRNKSEWAPNLKNKYGKHVIQRPEIVEVATEFFSTLYASEQSQTIEPQPMQQRIDHESILYTSILQEEIRHVINSQKMNKTPGDDNITNELLRALSEPLQSSLKALFDNILFTGTTPKQWSIL